MNSALINVQVHCSIDKYQTSFVFNITGILNSEMLLNENPFLSWFSSLATNWQQLILK